MSRNISRQQLFSTVTAPRLQRSQFDRSHGWKATMNFGKMVPFYHDMMYPGDTFKMRTNVLARFLSPLKTPIMDNMWLDMIFFFVPLRLLQTNFVKLMGEQTNPGDSISFLAPISTAPAGGYANGSLQDYLGLPTKIAGYTHTTYATRAYNLIWNQWLRPEDTVNSVTVDLGDGPDTVTNYVLLDAFKRHDYFTSMLPWTQKFTSPSVGVTGTGAVTPISGVGNDPLFGSSATNTGTSSLIGSAGAASFSGSLTANPVYWGTRTGLQVLGSSFTGISLDELRSSLAIKQLMERDARGGTRYQELIMAHFDVSPEDFRLNRPEFLNMSSRRLDVNQVAQTSATGLTGGTTGLGALGAYSLGTGQAGFTYSAREHGIVMGLIRARADLNYQQGLHRDFSTRSRYQFFWPDLAHISEQAVLSKELYCDGTANDDLVLGYQEAYAHLRYKPSQICGQLRSNDATPLDLWHLAQNFSVRPTLGQTFMTENPPISRVVAVTTVPALVIDAWHELICARPLPVHGDPGLRRL